MALYDVSYHGKWNNESFNYDDDDLLPVASKPYSLKASGVFRGIQTIFGKKSIKNVKE